MSAGGTLAKTKEESLHYCYGLEIFKDKVNESNELYCKLQLQFLAWFDNLLLVRRELVQENDAKCDKMFNSVDKYVANAELIFDYILSRINNKFNDDQLTEEFKTSREIFDFFHEMCKIYYLFQPWIEPAVCSPVESSNSNTHKQFPKIVQLLAEKINIPETDCATLAQIPPNFPTIKFAYLMLLSELIGIEKTASCEEAALFSKLDQSQLPLFCPPPRIVSNDPTFLQLKNLQKDLISQIQQIHENNKHQTQYIISQLQCYGECIENLHQTIKVEAPTVLDNSKKVYQAFLEVTEQKRENNFLSQLRNELPLNIDTNSIQNFINFEEKFIESESEHFDELLAKIKSHIELANKELRELQSIVDSKNKKLQLNEKIIPLSENKATSNEYPLQKLPQALEDHNAFVMNSLESLSIPPPIEMCFEINSNFISDEFLESIVIQPGVQGWYNTCINYMSHCVAEKQDELNRIQIETNQIYLRAHLQNETANVLKKKKSKEAPFCRSCEIARMYAITTCGHTFCEGCYREMIAASPHVCKYCGKFFNDLQVIQINW